MSANALRQKCTWSVSETAWRPECLEQWDRGIREEIECGVPVGPLQVTRRLGFVPSEMEASVGFEQKRDGSGLGF